MNSLSIRCLALCFGLSLAALNAGCGHQSVAAPTPQQRFTDIAANIHIPPAQKAAIEAQLAEREKESGTN